MSLDQKQVEQVWLAGRLHKQDIPEAVWNALLAHGYIHKARSGKISWEKVAEHAKTLLPYGELMESIGSDTNQGEEQEVSQEEPPHLTEYEWGRAQVLAEYVALKALGEGSVQMFYRLVASEEFYKEYEQLQEFREENPDSWQEVVEKDSELHTSIYEALKTAGRTLEEDFNYWSAGKAMEFLLDGEAVVRPPVEVEGDNPGRGHPGYGTINLKVEPWVPTETLVRFYQYHQKRILGHRPRALSQRNLNLASFVFAQLRSMWSEEMERIRALEEPAGRPRGSFWRTLMGLWNESNPQEAYEDERRFRRDFYRAAHGVVYPYRFKLSDVEKETIESEEGRGVSDAST